MNCSNQYRWLLLYFSMFAAISASQAQVHQVSSDDSLEVYHSIQPTALEDSIAIDPQLCKNLANVYLSGLNYIQPNDFRNASRIEELVKFYSTKPGIKKVLAYWIVQTNDKSRKSVVGIDRILIQMIRLDSKDSSSRGLDPDVENKYATLLINCESQAKNYEIYLNMQLVCLVSEAINGIRINSDKEYVCEIRNESVAVCQFKIKLKAREQKTIKCGAR